MDIIFPAKIDKGNLVLNDPDKFREYLRSLDGQIVQVIVRKPKRIRSLNQNAYYFGVVIPILSDNTGYSSEEIHSVLKEKFLSKIIILAGKEERISRSSTELSTIEWEKWMAEIKEWAALELSCVIPDPNQVDYTEDNY